MRMIERRKKYSKMGEIFENGRNIRKWEKYSKMKVSKT